MKKFLMLFITPLFFSLASDAMVLNGIDVLEKNDFKDLQGAKVALITNHTGCNFRGKSTVDLFHAAEEVQLVAILSPEHGFRGTVGHGEKIQDSKDPKTGIPIFSLYGETKSPTDRMLEGVDTIVYDIQDIGTRFYTYIATMAMAMEEAAKRGLRFVILDRPNPLRGDIMEGDLLDPDIKRLTGYFEIPTRYGLTVGELGVWYNATADIGAHVQVIPLKNWNRNMWFDQTKLPFIPPSPNIRNLTAAILYPGIGCFEATNISVGRGTDTPFEIFGSTWIHGKSFCAVLRKQNLPGVLFEPVKFKPDSDLYKGQTCEGVRIVVTHREKMKPFEIFLAAFLYLFQNYPEDFRPEWEEIRIMTGNHLLQDVALGKINLSTLQSQYDKTTAEFKKQISPYYLYP